MDSLDLHNIRHLEVDKLLHDFIYNHIQRGSTEVKIITGKSPQMKEIVNRIAGDYDMVTSLEWGNDGCLILDMK